MAADSDLHTLERETEEARNRLADTLDRLTSPSTAQSVKQELLGYGQGLKDSGRQRVQGFTSDLKDRALANPLGLALIGAGIGYRLYRHPPVTTLLVGAGIATLMMGGSSRQADRRAYRDPYNRDQPRGYVPGGVAGYGYPVGEEPPGSTATEKVSAVASRASEMARDVATKARDAAQETAARVSHAAESATSTMSEVVERTTSTVSNVVERTTAGIAMAAHDTADRAGNLLRDTRRTLTETPGRVRSSTSDAVARTTSRVGELTDDVVNRAANMFQDAPRNPVLLGVLGIAAGTAVALALRSGDREGSNVRVQERRPPDRGTRRMRSGGSPRAQRYEGDAVRQAGERLSNARARTADAASDIASAAGDTLSSVAARTSDTATGIASSAGDLASSAGEMAARIPAAASRVIGSAGELATSSASTVYDVGASTYEGTLYAARRAGRQASRAGTWLREEVDEIGDESPLLLGAIGLALGAAVGAVVRSTEAENRIMGDMSDTVKQRARELVEQQYGEVQTTAEQMVDRLQTRFGELGQPKDVSSDWETVIGGGQPPVAAAEPSQAGAGTPGAGSNSRPG